MGNENSNSNDDNNVLKNDFDGDISFGICDNISSYKGMKSDESEKETDRKSSSDISEKTTEQTLEVDEKTVPVEIEWKEGGGRVQLTGSFANWNQFFEMLKDQNGQFKLKLTLPKEKIQFKFIVDNVWRTSSGYPTMDDGSYNINNYLDLTNVKIEKPVQERRVTKEKEKEKEKEDAYISSYPNRADMNADAPHAPTHYVNKFRINNNSNQNVIGRKKFLESEANLNIDENNCYKNILPCSHVNLNHIISSCEKRRYVRCGKSQRFRCKNVTVIYYKPLYIKDI